MGIVACTEGVAQRATCVVGPSGIRFSTQSEARTLQAHAYLQESLFREYSLKEPRVDLHFELNVNVLLECLALFQHTTGETALELSAVQHGKELIIK